MRTGVSAHLVLSRIPLVVPELPSYSHLPVLCGCAQVTHGCRSHSLILEWPCPKGSRTGIWDVVVMENHGRLLLLLLSRLQRHSRCLWGGTESDKIHAGGQTNTKSPKTSRRSEGRGHPSVPPHTWAVAGDGPNPKDTSADTARLFITTWCIWEF